MLLKAVSRLKRTRVQMLLGFVTVMLVVLSVSGVLTYRLTSDLFIRNTMSSLAETAAQASGRIDATLAQVDSVSMLLVMDARVQQVLHRAKLGMDVPVEQRLSLRPIVDNVGSLSWLIASIDLYTETEPLYPLENKPLVEAIGREGLEAVRRESGRLVWIGAHPDDPSLLIAARQVRLEQDYLAGGGYMVLKVANSLGDVFHSEFSSIQGSSMHLFDQSGKLVASTSPATPDIRALGRMRGQPADGGGYGRIEFGGESYLHIVQQSEQVNWSIHMLVPLRSVTNELSALTKLSLYALVAGAVVCFVLTWVLSERIAMPIRKLRKKMSSVHFALPQTNEETYFNLEMNELNHAYNKLVRDLHRLIETVYEKERLKNRAEIKMLQAQIHPHFLFNTLETLYWNLSDKKDRDGAGLVIALSKLFRYSIKTSAGDDWVTLSEELEHCRRYLEIMKYRLAHRLTWSIDMPDTLSDTVVPKLLVQPLVENAIQHGIEQKIGRGSVAVDVQLAALADGTPTLLVRVRDDGAGMTPERLEEVRGRLTDGEADAPGADDGGAGIGMPNVVRRVRLHYGDKYGLAVDSETGRGTEVRLYLPYGGAAS